MPRSGPNGTYTLPGAQDEAQPNTTIQSSINNQGWADIEQTFNTVQPIPYGGTGQTDLVLPADKFGLKDSVDDSKRVAFDLSGISASTTRTLTVQDRNGTLAVLDDVNPWVSQPLGVPMPFFTHLAGVDLPPTDNPAFRYIKLTASDAYNAGVLTDESVTGSAPLVVATAKIDDALSPMDGETIHLINTERRVLRAGDAGIVQEDAMQRIVGSVYGRRLTAENVVNESGALSTGLMVGAGSSEYPSSGGSDANTQNKIIFDSGNSPGARVSDDETRVKNIGADYFMRIR